MKIIIVAIMALMLTGCGGAQRLWAWTTGEASNACMDGVLYYQFTSGAVVAYNKDGTVKLCN